MAASAALAATTAAMPLNYPLTYPNQQTQQKTTNNAANVSNSNTNGDREKQQEAAATDRVRTAAATTNFNFSPDPDRSGSPNFTSTPSERFRSYPATFNESLGPHPKVVVEIANVGTLSNQSDRRRTLTVNPTATDGQDDHAWPTRGHGDHTQPNH